MTTPIPPKSKKKTKSPLQQAAFRKMLAARDSAKKSKKTASAAPLAQSNNAPAAPSTATAQYRYQFNNTNK